MKHYSTLLFILCFLLAKAQVIYNAYANVTTISGTTFTVNNVNETNHTFVTGEKVVVMQMQDNVIGTNTLNTATFGNLGSIQSAGLWEIKTISAQTRSVGVLQTLSFSTPLVNTYNIGVNTSVQVISFRLLNAAAFSTTAAITGAAWNGTVGGIVALEVGTTLTLNHSISANGLGFRGGNRSNDYYGGGTTCTLIDYATASTNSAFKGEGIYKSTNVNFTNGLGRRLNGGGGGGQDVNGGGGGGGNYTAGGLGGIGWNSTAAGCPVASSPAGLGGLSLSSSILPSRIFMGGGGGGGQQNNTVGTNGGNGGGIIIIRANRIATTGSCGTPISITANGVSAATAANDGAGGGGAAGTIVLQVPSYSVVGTCSLIIAANGGNGGTVNSSTHAGGGAGAQGVLVFSSSQPTLNVQANTNNGTPGCNNGDVPCTSSAGTAGGSNNQGIFTNINGALSVEFLSFEASIHEVSKALLKWRVVESKPLLAFRVERSRNAVDWEIRTTLSSKSAQQLYEYVDAYPRKGINYYRITLVYADGSLSTSVIREVTVNQTEQPTVAIFPNPSSSLVTITSTGNINDLNISVYDLTGQLLSPITTLRAESELVLAFTNYPRGLYLIKIINQEGETIRLIKQVIE